MDKTKYKNVIFNKMAGEEKLLIYEKHESVRCTKCLLPSTMPFIKFDDQGVCNYCHNYKLRNQPRPKRSFLNYLKVIGEKKKDCIVPFSGGRDSSYGLHLAVKELGMKPITYTYNWGMVTDIAQQNIEIMCKKLSVKNITITADIRRNDQT